MSFRPPRKIIFVLTKIDITGQDRVALWTDYLREIYPDIRLVRVESYQEKTAGAGQGKRKSFEPHLPSDLRRNLVMALKEAHEELCTPPPSIAERKEKLATWKPKIRTDIDWNAVVNANEQSVTTSLTTQERSLDIDGGVPEGEEPEIEDFITVGLIGE